MTENAFPKLKSCLVENRLANLKTIISNIIPNTESIPERKHSVSPVQRIILGIKQDYTNVIPDTESMPERIHSVSPVPRTI